jgi:fatty acid CoA ligase FadD9
MSAPAPDPFQRAYQRLLALTQSDAEMAAILPSPAVSSAISQPGLSDYAIVSAVLDGYAERRALGRRSYEIVTDPVTGSRSRRYLPEFTTITYGELRDRVQGLANAWRHHAEHRLAAGEFVAIFGFTGMEYAIVDIGCLYARAVIVPLQANLAHADLTKILAETSPAALVTHIDHLEMVVALAAANGGVRSLVVMDADARDDDDQARLQAARAELAKNGSPIAVATLDELIEYGRAFEWTPPANSAEGEQRLSAVMYTSGSTGTPKGALLPEYYTKTMCWTLSGPAAPTITLAYAPMNHMMGRISVFSTLTQGGTVYFALKSDMSTLFDDIRIARPTLFSFLPRIATMVYQYFQTEVLGRLEGSGRDRASVESEVMAEMRETFLGNRLRVGSLGSAPTAPEVKQFLIDCFDIAFVEGYGTTEAGTITMNSRMLPHVTEYKLRDVPELGYFSSDKPYPRGELLVKSKLLIPGYFKHPELNSTLNDADGFQQTGDVVEERGPGYVVWLDRKNNVLKLSQGEYVAVGALEASFVGASALIKQIYVYGSSYRSFLLAVVVPDIDHAVKMLGRTPTPAELHSLARTVIQDAAQELKLRSFEIPRDVMIEMEPFSYENGLLTSVRKPVRPKLKQKYGDRLEALYEQMERKQQEDLALLKRSDSGMSTLERVGKVLESALGVSDLDLLRENSFAELGGDSLGAVSFALLLEEIFGVPVPVSAILNPAGSPQRWARLIDRALTGSDEWHIPTLAEVHGESPHLLHAASLKLSAFFDTSALKSAAPVAAEPAKTVLITGASGYLGRFLCMDWLEHAARVGGKVICLIRAADATAARRRLERALGSDPLLAQRFRALAERHLEVLAGDLTDVRLGLSAADYDRLAAEVDQIVHPAALVNHRLSYQHLFDPNVVGTAELIRLALTRRLKRFDFVSSLGVVLTADDPAQMSEGADIRITRPSAMISERYATGYAASKWAGEVLLREAHEQFGLPVNVFRSDMILAHSAYAGQINVPDMFTRLLYSVVATGLAPESFYEREADGSRAKAHYDGLPVDFIAGAMTEIGAKPYTGFHSYNVVNLHHGDGVSLDRIVDWIASAGYAVERIPSHAQWIERFGMKLRNLPDEQRQHSALQILEAFEREQPLHDIVVQSGAFEAAVRALSIGPAVPHLSEAFVHKCLDDLRVLGLLPEPGKSNAAA